MDELYNREFIESLPEISDKWKAPLVSYITKGSSESVKNLKEFIVKWYDKIPGDKKTDSYNRLRSLNDDELKAKVYEFLVAEFCCSIGGIEFDPTIEGGKTPELLWKIDDQIGLLDVVMLSDDKLNKENNHDIDDLLNYLKSIQHEKYDLIITYDYISRSCKKKEIKNIIAKYLQEINQSSNEIHNLHIDREDFIGEIDFIARKSTDKRKVEFGVMNPVRCITPINAINKRIRQKLSKYKWDGPIFVAICNNSDFGCDWDDVAEILYGKESVVYNPITGETNPKIDGKGMLMPRPDKTILNTSLTGVLHCQLKFIDNKPNLEVKYLKNPFAKYRVELDIPTYPKVNENTIVFEWYNL